MKTYSDQPIAKPVVVVPVVELATDSILQVRTSFGGVRVWCPCIVCARKRGLS